ncbi:MAG: winged helix-turn-helix transcriptional regulator [Clostridiales bacterium]|jgi:DNA-binding transcriptional ArsR family regulator|nr:winged helix-turn-helix transcriptional regulator [Clostridiales bacterium]
MDAIVLSGKRELDIFVNPQRQNLLRAMRVAGVPMTPKQLSARVGISPSAVQHHIRKLLELGVVELSHTERIHGITASYYRVSPRDVSIGVLPRDGLGEERLACIQGALSAVFSGYADYVRRGVAEGEQFGDALTGVIRLNHDEARELYGMIRRFLDERRREGRDGSPWEYALIAYPVAEAGDA